MVFKYFSIIGGVFWGSLRNKMQIHRKPTILCSTERSA